MSMMIYTDPHQGLNLVANTTVNSRRCLQREIGNRLRRVIKAYSPRQMEKQVLHDTICVGDFFHNYSNDEGVILDSLTAASETTTILGGNHDVVNNVDAKGSLCIIDEVCHNVVMPVFNKVVLTHRDSLDGKNYLMFVPHHSSQELFEQALEKACEEVGVVTGKKKFLFVHCNYNSGFATQETALNLTKHDASYLLEHFDYVVVGHDHHHKTDFDGRLIVLGSFHPTNFGDCDSDHHIMLVTDNGEVEFRTVWDSSRYIEVGYQEIDSIEVGYHEFVRITGAVTPDQVSELTKKIKAIWTEAAKTHEPGKEHPLFAIKSDVIVMSGTDTDSSGMSKSVEKLTDRIEAELSSTPELLAIWKEISNDSQS